MFSPATKGWIPKYIEMFQRQNLEEVVIKENLKLNSDGLYDLLSKSGVFFGLATESVFLKDVNFSKTTSEEKLRLLLFESFMLVYINNVNQNRKNLEVFVSTLTDFYKNHSSWSLKKLPTFFLKESPTERLEAILAKRVVADLNILKSKFFLQSLNNSFIYIDVILYREYLKNGQHLDENLRSKYTNLVMKAIVLAIRADNDVDDREKAIFDVFLASASLKKQFQKEIIEAFEGNRLFDIREFEAELPLLFKRYILDIVAFIISANHESLESELKVLKQLSKALGFTKIERQDVIVNVQRFVLLHADKMPFLQDSSSIEKFYGSVSERWVKVLGRNKDKLAQELGQSKELVGLIAKSTTTELTKEEKEKVKTQFIDIAKSMPALAIFLLPGGAVLLPLILKVLPSLIPTSFRENELENPEKGKKYE